jgi:hypothetical protein
MKALKRLIQITLGGIVTMLLIDLLYHYLEDDWKVSIVDVISIVWVVTFTLILIRTLIELHSRKKKIPI